ncbi:mrps-2 [Pristionchus pacificus]|uniref:Small ribosomal subunit protein uS2m n=1 Tax=Pristionchus pacificus TaxID=54126 RepID=A0A454Y515_PRIPA|nr:mrps-2 [Pristionchus pacificus]|eukprot:PDM75052.1 mrps-2 [Pristionchus pacificus]
MNSAALRSLIRRVGASGARPFSAKTAAADASATTRPRGAPSADTLQKGSVQPTVLRPYVAPELETEDLFGLHSLVNVDEMFEARLHYGHKIGTLHENMKWALYGERLGVCIFDLEITRKHLIRALDFVAHVVSRGGIILFISTHRDTMLDVEKMAEEVGQYAHVRFWQEGTLTNMKQLLGASVRMPDTMVFLSSLTSMSERHPAIIEAAKMTIPTVGIVDSNSDPSYLTYLVPSNDDSPQAVAYLLRLFKEACQRGAAYRAKQL